jgi:hypothetical protein
VARFIRWTALTTSLIALAGIAGSAKDNVEIRLSGKYYAAPATVQLVVAIEPDAQNRTLRVEADGDNMYTSSEVQLAGDREQRLHMIQFKNLAAGEYTLRAQVLSGSAVRSQAEQEIMVTGGPGEDDPSGW